jgi:hypothetical protein
LRTRLAALLQISGLQRLALRVKVSEPWGCVIAEEDDDGHIFTLRARPPPGVIKGRDPAERIAPRTTLRSRRGTDRLAKRVSAMRGGTSSGLALPGPLPPGFSSPSSHRTGWGSQPMERAFAGRSQLQGAQRQRGTAEATFMKFIKRSQSAPLQHSVCRERR